LAGGSARWRVSGNVLVHGYLDLNLGLVAATMTAESLEDFETFADHVEQWLEANPE